MILAGKPQWRSGPPILGRRYINPPIAWEARLMKKLRRLAGGDKEPNSAAFQQGKLDCIRGMTANPYGHPADRDAWEAGHAKAFASGLGELPSFKHIARKRRTQQA